MTTFFVPGDYKKLLAMKRAARASSVFQSAALNVVIMVFLINKSLSSLGSLKFDLDVSPEETSESTTRHPSETNLADIGISSAKTAYSLEEV